jgi:replicative DNA helicase
MVSIEQSIFKALLYSEEYVRRVLPYLDDSYFDGSQRTLFQVYKRLFDEYNSVPTFEALAVTLQNEKIGDTEFNEVAELIGECHKTKDDLPDVQWLVDETEQYCRDKKIYNAIYESINIIEGSNTKLDKHAIPEMLDEALAVSFDQSIGMEFFDDAERRYELYNDDDTRIKFPLECLNHLSNGGLKPKSLSCILAGPNVGKSSMMSYLSGEFLRTGKNVVYISMEMGEELIHERVEANLLGVSTDNLKKMDRNTFLGKIDSIHKKTNGRFFAKEYPTGSAHVGHFRHLLKELKQKKKFKPDVVFVDYLNICASSRYKTMNGINSYSYVKAIGEELRGLAVEFGIPIVTATQLTRGGSSESSPDMTSISESFGTAHTMDWLIAATTDEVLQENGQQLLHLLKTRWGNKSKAKPQLVNVDFDLMRYSDVGSTQEVVNKVGNRKPEKKEKKVEDIDWG